MSRVSILIQLVLLASKANGKRPVGRPRTRWSNYVEDLGWNLLELHPSEMVEVMKDREVWRLNLALLPLNPPVKVGNEEGKLKSFNFTGELVERQRVHPWSV